MYANKTTRTGYHWRDELVDRLLPYVKDGVDRILLTNIVRGYVPIFFPTDLPDTGDANWLFVFSLGSGNHWWKQEIEAIGSELTQTSSINDKFVKRVFKKYRWEVDKSVEGRIGEGYTSQVLDVSRCHDISLLIQSTNE